MSISIKQNENVLKCAYQFLTLKNWTLDDDERTALHSCVQFAQKEIAGAILKVVIIMGTLI